LSPTIIKNANLHLNKIHNEKSSKIAAAQVMVGKKNILQGQRKVREICLELGKIDILKISKGKYFLSLKGRRNIWSHRDLNDNVTKKNENLLKTY